MRLRWAVMTCKLCLKDWPWLWVLLGATEHEQLWDMYSPGSEKIRWVFREAAGIGSGKASYNHSCWSTPQLAKCSCLMKADISRAFPQSHALVKCFLPCNPLHIPGSNEPKLKTRKLRLKEAIAAPWEAMWGVGAEWLRGCYRHKQHLARAYCVPGSVGCAFHLILTDQLHLSLWQVHFPFAQAQSFGIILFHTHI